MKTPHRITLLRGEGLEGRYDPKTDSYLFGEEEDQTVPCLVSFLPQAKVFEDYGSRERVVIACRFQQVQKPFSKAIFEGETYLPIEKLDHPIKGSVRLRKAGNDG